MAKYVYTGSVSEATGLNQTPSVSLSGSGDPASGVLNSVTALLTFSTNSYGTTYNVTATLNYSGGSKTSTQSVKMNSSNYTNAQFSFTFSGLTVDQANSISSVTVKSSNDSTKIFLRGTQTVTVDYTVLSACGAPTNLKLSANNVGFGKSVTLSWTAGTPGENVSIKGYHVYKNGSYLGETAGTSYGVKSPSSNSSDTYKVKTIGSVSGYDSGFSNEVTLTSVVAACEEPTDLVLSGNDVGFSTNVTLSWTAAKAGTNNSVARYDVYRNNTFLVSSTTLSCTVTSPSSNGSYTYKVKAIGSVSGFDSGYSEEITLTSKVTECEAPSSVSVDTSSVAPGAKVTLSWSGAKAGTNNAITGYKIYRATGANNTYSLLTTVSSTSTSHSTTVTAPTANGSAYHYKVQTIGTVGGYDSEQSSSSAELACSFASVGAPTVVKLSATNAAPGAPVELSWSGATEGDNNVIVGYRVYLAESVDGDYKLNGEMGSSSTAGSQTVYAPAVNGATYYYRVQTCGSLSSSSLSSAYASLTCTYSTPAAPSTVTINGETSAYVTPGTTVTLAWSGATSGANNSIKGYTLYRDGVVYVSGLASNVSSYDVPSHTTAGKAYTYTVVTLGEHSNSAPSLARVVYSYTDPAAPTTVTVSNDEPTAGERVTLSWSGATAGGYNDIVGYRVYRASYVGGARTQVAYVHSSDTHGSCYVTAPSNVGGLYVFYVETIGSYSASDVSAAYASIQTTKEAEGADGDTTVVVPAPTRRKKRGFIFGDYDTAVNGWTLTGWEFPEPEAQTSYVDIPGRMKGPLDLSTSLTDGDPRYGNRELTALFELSEGTRKERIEVIDELVNQLHGQTVEIVFPDDDSRYAVGRLNVRNDYNDMAHAEVSIAAICEPWRYNKQETVVSLMATAETNTAVLHNAGRCVLVPEINVIGGSASVRLACGEHAWTLREGNYQLPDLELHKGNTIITYSGIGSLVFKYREAIL